MFSIIRRKDRARRVGVIPEVDCLDDSITEVSVVRKHHKAASKLSTTQPLPRVESLLCPESARTSMNPKSGLVRNGNGRFLQITTILRATPPPGETRLW